MFILSKNLFNFALLEILHLSDVTFNATMLKVINFNFKNAKRFTKYEIFIMKK